MTLRFDWVDGGPWAVCRLPADAPLPAWAAGRFTSITRTADELSVIAPAAVVPPDVEASTGWDLLRVVGTLDFAQVGVAARITAALADAGVSVLVVSTHDTDYVLVRAADRPRIAGALAPVGPFEGTTP